MGVVTRGRRARAFRHAVGLAAAAAFLLPLAFVAAGSLREVGPLAPVPDLIPGRPTLDNYRLAFEVTDLARQALNSTALAIVVVPLSILVAAAAGFALTRLPNRTRAVLITLSFASAMVPLSMMIVGRFTLFSTIGVNGTYVPLVATALLGGSPFNVLLFYVAFRRMPPELFDAARLDGASVGQILLKVALPSVPYIVLAVGVITFAATWGNVLEPLVYLADERMYTLPLGLRSLAALDVPNQPIMLAAAMLSIVVPATLLLLAQRHASRHWHEHL